MPKNGSVGYSANTPRSAWHIHSEEAREHIDYHERNRAITRAALLDKQTLAALSLRYGVGKERIAQIIRETCQRHNPQYYAAAVSTQGYPRLAYLRQHADAWGF